MRPAGSGGEKSPTRSGCAFAAQPLANRLVDDAVRERIPRCRPGRAGLAYAREGRSGFAVCCRGLGRAGWRAVDAGEDGGVAEGSGAVEVFEAGGVVGSVGGEDGVGARCLVEDPFGGDGHDDCGCVGGGLEFRDRVPWLWASGTAGPG